MYTVFGTFLNAQTKSKSVGKRQKKLYLPDILVMSGHDDSKDCAIISISCAMFWWYTPFVVTEIKF